VKLDTYTSKAQTYIPLISDTNAIWGVYNHTLDLSTPCESNEYRAYYIKGDSLIGNKKFYKLFYTRKIEYQDSPLPYPGGSICGQNGITYYRSSQPILLREENKIVYSGTTIIYNFNLTVGDTVPNSYNGIITSIDSILIGSRYHKRFNVKVGPFIPNPTPMPSTIIEGIGSSFGLTYKQINVLQSFNLGCFSNSIDTLYGACNINVGVKENKTVAQLITLYPNPTTGTLSLAGLAYSGYTYKLINATGAIVLEGSFTEDSATISLPTNVSNGLYNLLLYNTTTGAMYTKSIALQR
jgi:hypothetical protein